MSSVMLTRLPQTGFRRTPWKNGGGISIDIADRHEDGAAPGAWDRMLWRLGRTAITQAGPFSDMTGFERRQVVIAGSGLVLVADGHEIDLRRPLAPVVYDGTLPLVSRLENGPVEVVNLIARRAVFDTDLRVLMVDEGLTLTPGHHIIYAFQTGVNLIIDAEKAEIDSGDALLIDIAKQSPLTIATGTALLASIFPKV